MEFRCIRKDKFFNKHYILVIKNQSIEIGKVSKFHLSKVQNPPKYTLKFFSKSSINWMIKDDKLIGFEFFGNNKLVKFEMRSDVCQLLWEQVKGQLFFQNLYQFYKPIYEIGKGHFSNVVKVVSYLNKNMYACKCIEIKEEFTEEVLQINLQKDIMNEIQIHQSMNHQNIVKLLNVSRTCKHFFLIMELTQGETLKSFMNKKIKFKDEEIISIMKQLLSAVEYMHKHHIIHRDIKPENILLSSINDTTGIKLIDFGLATKLTSENVNFKICGTPGYVAPEIINSEGEAIYDEKCDIFSCGAILYNLYFFITQPRLTSHMLFEGDSKSEIYYKNKYFKIPEIKLSSNCYHYQNLLNLMLEVDPKDRINSSGCLFILENIQKQIEEIPEDDSIQHLPIMIAAKPKSEPVLIHIDF